MISNIVGVNCWCYKWESISRDAQSGNNASSYRKSNKCFLRKEIRIKCGNADYKLAWAASY